jgi:rhamnulokinase
MPQKIEQFCKSTKQRHPLIARRVRPHVPRIPRAHLPPHAGRAPGRARPENHIIHIVGGGSQNELLNQMTADACGKTVIAGPGEATAAGNILVQAMALGDVSSLAALRHIVRESFELKRYEPKNPASWDSAYAKFRQLV